MSVREYIGARYVMKFADPIQHASDTAYEPLTVVQYQGASYISKQYVPIGIDISNDDYWILMADYDAQIEQYRSEVETFSGSIEANTDDISSLKSIIPSTSFDSTNTVKAYIDNIKNIIPASAFDSTNTVKAAIDELSAFDIEIDSRMDTAEGSISDILSNYVYTFNTFTDAINA